MPEQHPTAEQHPVGTCLVRLRDIPLEIRLRALDELLAAGAKTPIEERRLRRIARRPGDAGGRIAA